MGVLLVMQCLVTVGSVTKRDNLHCGLWKIFGWCDPRSKKEAKSRKLMTKLRLNSKVYENSEKVILTSQKLSSSSDNSNILFKGRKRMKSYIFVFVFFAL